jgi:ActR/RegA family two-component response regulator
MSSANAPAPSVSVGGALLVSNDAVTIRQVGESMRQLAMSPDICADIPTAFDLLLKQKFDAVVVDLQLGNEARKVLEKVRLSPANRTAVLFAISATDEETASAFKDGSNFVFRRPLSYTSIDRTLRVAYGLIVRERRRYFRCPADIALVINRPETEDVHAQCINISEGGMAFKASVEFSNGTHVSVQFKLPDHDSTFVVESTICWCRDGLIGLQFTSLTPERVSELQEWLARRLEESFPEFVAAKFRNLGNASAGPREHPDEAVTAEEWQNADRDWVELYRAAMSEPNPEKRLRKTEAAKQVVRERWRELVSLGSDDSAERQRLSNALEKMTRLTEIGNWEDD